MNERGCDIDPGQERCTDRIVWSVLEPEIGAESGYNAEEYELSDSEVHEDDDDLNSDSNSDSDSETDESSDTTSHAVAATHAATLIGDAESGEEYDAPIGVGGSGGDDEEDLDPLHAQDSEVRGLVEGMADSTSDIDLVLDAASTNNTVEG